MKTAELSQLYNHNPHITTAGRNFPECSLFFEFTRDRFHGNAGEAKSFADGSAYAFVY